MLRACFLVAAGLASAARADGPTSEQLAASGKERHRLLRLATDAAAAAGHWRESLKLAQDAAALPERTRDDLYAAFRAAIGLHDRRWAVVTLTAWARFDATAFRSVDELAIWQTFQQARELVPGDGAGFELFEIAFERGYRTNAGDVRGPVWIDLASQLQSRGDAAKAARVIAEIDRPTDLVDVRADKRFASIVDTDSARFDVVAAANRRVERLRRAVSLSPRSLEILIALAEAEKEAGHLARALAVLDDGLARATSPGAFEDRDQQLNWLHDHRANVLWRLGRRDESTAELQLGMAIRENGLSNVSQVINLAQRSVAIDQPTLALKTLDRLDAEPSPYGKMAREYVRLAAADELGDQASMDAALEYLREHEADAPRILRDGFVLTGLLDEAARVFIGELDDPTFRTSALHAVQQFDDVSSGLTPARWETYWKRLLARSDVKAAIAKYGRVQRYHLAPL
jgi:hypothetical protein